MGIYESLGVQPVINAAGPVTRLSGAPLHPEVAAAMAEATQACVRIEDLQEAAMIAFPTKAPSATTLWSNYPQRHHELTEEEAKYLAPILTESMDPVAVLLVETTGHHFTPMAMKEHLKRPFLYAFEKGIEIVYKTRVASDEPVEFNFDTLQHDADKPLPEFLQMNIAPLIPTVMFIFQETIDFAEQEATSAVGIEELFKSILTGAMFLGVEFGLRIDVDDREVVK